MILFFRLRVPWSTILGVACCSVAIFFLLLTLPFSNSFRLPASVPSAPSLHSIPQQKIQSYGHLSLGFEANYGQANAKVRYLSHGSGHAFFFFPDSAELNLVSANGGAGPRNQNGSFQGRAVDSSINRTLTRGRSARAHSQVTVGNVQLLLIGANRLARMEGLEELPGTSNYFIGSNPKNWHVNVPHYAKVRSAGVYPGVDVIYHGEHDKLEFDFVVAAHADPEQISLELRGVKELRMDNDGDIRFRFDGQELRLEKPVVYQELEGKRTSLSGRFVLNSRKQVGFELGAYDRGRALVIDPVLSYSTGLGSDFADTANGIAVDAIGNAYVTGTSASGNFPTTAGAFQTKFAGPGSPACVPRER